MSQKKRSHRPMTKPRVRPADGWVLFECFRCLGSNYCPPGQAYCNNLNCVKEGTDDETIGIEASGD